MQDTQELILGDLDIETGHLYCGGKEGYLEVLQVLLEDAQKNRMQMEEYYNTQNWMNYIIAVHAVKSSMLSIGAIALSEMAKKLEFAGKQKEFEYIHDNHEEMLKEYDRVYQILAENPLINPPKEAVIMENNLPEIQEAQMEQYMTLFEDAVYDFDEGRMLEVLAGMQGYQWKGMALAELLMPVKRKVEMMDYMSALDLMQKL